MKLLVVLAALASSHGYLHTQDAAKAADRYMHVTAADHATTTCHRWSRTEVDCKVILRGVNPDGVSDPAWTSAWHVQVTLGHGRIRARIAA